MTEVLKFQKKLLAWYQINKRDLPWRKTSDPYAIWISEIMLQQTQVKTVIPYYQKWLNKFPTVQKLAKSPIQAVLKQWEGLGYYRRAHNIHACAKKIVSEFSGKFPKNIADLMELPGIGRYTAGAIGSIAFDLKAPILDGNVERILCRIFGISADVSKSETKKILWQWAEKVLPSKNSCDFNQAMMELGATVCFPLSPDCEKCPVSGICQSLEKNQVEALPFNSQKTEITKRRRAALLIQHDGELLIQKRSHQKLMNGLWELPGFEIRSGKVNVLDIQNFLKGHFDLEVSDVKKGPQSRYTITRYIIDLETYECRVKAKKAIPQAKWFDLQSASKIPMAGHQRKILNLIPNSKLK